MSYSHSGNEKAMLLLAGLVAFFILFSVYSQAEPSYQYSKLLLTPFYKESMSQNVNYTYSVTLTPPDKIGAIQSAIITLDAWINPTRTFYAWANGQACNTPSYTISTTYASAGNAKITFDCTNAILPNKQNNVTLRVIGGNIGASTAWLEAVYSNNPKGKVDVKGTEYVFDPMTNSNYAKPWLQLLNASGDFVTSGVCYLEIHSPDNSNYLQRALMLNLNTHGIYYYDIQVPTTEGVYPVIAECYYEAVQTTEYPYQYFLINGTYNSGTIADTYTDDGAFLRLREAPAGNPRILRVGFDWNISESCTNISEDLLRGVDLHFETKFDSVAGDNINFSIFNYSSNIYIPLPNIALEGNTWRLTTNSLETNNVTTSGFVNASDGIKILIQDTDLADGGTDDFDTDQALVHCEVLSNPDWQEVKGSSEMHVTNISRYTENIWNRPVRNLTYYYNATEDVWQYGNRTLTFYPEQVDLTNYTYIFSALPDYVWNASNRSLTFYPAQQDLTNYSFIFEGVWMYVNRTLTFYPEQVDLTNYTLISEGIWAYSIRNLTFFPEQLDLTNYTLISEGVWTYFNRTLTYYPAQLDLTNYTLINDGVWSYSNRTLTFYPPQYDLTNYSLINEGVALYVWNASNRSLTFYPTQTDLTNYSLINQGVWEYANRTLTYYPPQIDMTNYSYASEIVWAYANRTLTFYPLQLDLTNYTLINEGVAEAVWSYINRTLTFYQNFTQPELTPDEIWSYYNRTLTYYPQQEDLTNYTLISEVVWNYLNRTLTYYENFTQPELTAEDVWTYTTRNLTFYPAQEDLTNYSLINEGVWTFASRNLTFYPNTTTLTAQDVWEYSVRNLTTPILTAQDVWEYTSRNLTYYPSVDPTNYSLIADVVWQAGNRSLTLYYNATDDVWSYANRNLTFFPTFPAQVDLTNYTLINNSINEIWNYGNRTLTFYPTQEDLTNYSLINDGVWTYAGRNLTYYPAFSTLTASDVWTYGTRDLTTTLLTAYDVWHYNVRNLTFYPDANYTDLILNLTSGSIAESVWLYSDRVVSVNGTINASINLTQVENVITGLAVFDQNATLVPGRCPTTTGASLTLGFFILLSLIMIYAGFKWKVGALGIFASILLIVLSWFIAPCNVILGYICVFTGLVMIIVFAIRVFSGGNK